MHKLRLVPLGSESVEERVAAFRQYNDEVRNGIDTCFIKKLGKQLLFKVLLEKLGFCSVVSHLLIHFFILYLIQIRRNLPDVLLATMNILYTKYRSTRSVALMRSILLIHFSTVLRLSKLFQFLLHICCLQRQYSEPIN